MEVRLIIFFPDTGQYLESWEGSMTREVKAAHTFQDETEIQAWIDNGFKYSFPSDDLHAVFEIKKIAWMPLI